MIHQTASAGLLHLIGWELGSDPIELSEHIKICGSENSRIWQLYETLCAETQVDDGEPFLYDCYVLMEPDGVTDNINFGDPYCLFDRVCNVIALILGQTIGMSRVLFSEDNFETCTRTYTVFTYGVQTEFLLEGNASIDEEKARDIKRAWETSSEMWEKHKLSGRVNSALAYFYYAWRSPFLDQTCLNLAVCMELLFTPHAQGEASHQISFNVARFLGESSSEMKDIYRSVRNFYGIRSRIVHGGMPEETKIKATTIEAFALCARSLRKILLKGFAQIFNNDSRRQELLLSFLFK